MPGWLGLARAAAARTGRDLEEQRGTVGGWMDGTVGGWMDGTAGGWMDGTGGAWMGLLDGP